MYMARLPLTANTTENSAGLDDYSPIPAGTVIASIQSSGYKPTKAKTGNYLQLKWVVLMGKYKGRNLFDNLNLDNPNPIAVEIANKSLNSICKACNKVGVKDSEELHGIPVKLTLSVQPASSTQPASNDIKGYAPVTAEDAVQDTTPASAPNKAVNAPVTKKLPWE